MRMKYIAAGFLNDADKLLKDFTAENSLEFKVFASVWKKHNFSLIYMGRETEKELCEFTAEIFRVSVQFLTAESSFKRNVGGIFLLYALYRNQIQSPPVRIRLLPSDFQNILQVRDTAVEKKYRSLHYVIDYMIENSFDFVAHPTLLGPKTPKMESVQKKSEKISNFEENITSGLNEFLGSSVLEGINNLSKESENLAKKLSIPILLSSNDDYSETINNLKALINSGSCTETRNTSKVSEGIGLRRAQIKATAFENQAVYRLGNGVESDVDGHELDEDYSPKKIKRKVRPRVPKSERKLGRPRKTPAKESVKEHESESESNDESFPHLVVDLLPPMCTLEKKREKPIRNKRYYAE